MKFNKKAFKSAHLSTYHTKNSAVIDVERFNERAVMIKIDDFIFLPSSLRETAILFLKMADALDEAEKEAKRAGDE